MDIKQAKTQIKNAMVAYFSKDENGAYRMPVERQRPVFLLGAPGIGKTAIMAQIADELGVGLVSYSMTHHTRQSALGLPFIATKSYGGVEYQVSEYTMSEIIASVFDEIERSGRPEGILFLDEINCVSETLTPAILQFLQYKVFGRHQVPEGWIVVTAGNPREFNRSIHDFDIATWDRLKRIDVEPDFPAWKEYALAAGVHPAILSYLEIERGDFYRVETTVDGKAFVTARGWDDLSQMLYLYEENGIDVDALLVAQYVQHPEAARRFAVYYDLFRKYRSDYQVEGILAGEADDSILARAQAAGFDERVSLVGLLVDAVGERTADAVVRERIVARIHDVVAPLRDACDADGGKAVLDACRVSADACRDEADQARVVSGRATERYRIATAAATFFDACCKGRDALTFDEVKAAFAEEVDRAQAAVDRASGALDHAFAFVEEAFGEGQEMLLLVTDLSCDRYGTEFINEHGCDRYFEHNEALLFYERGRDLAERIARISED